METAELINQLGVRHRVTAAYRTLFGMGFAAVPAAREGLRHANADVRSHCVRLLDHFLVPEALSELIGMLHDPDPQVRRSALHTLACDRCKEGVLTPTVPMPPVELGLLSPSNPAGLTARRQVTAFTQIANIAGTPAMSVPLCWNEAGLPIGIQFIGHYGDEATLFRLAGQLEHARPWFSRRPPWSSPPGRNVR